MRNAFADELKKAAEENDKVILLSADIGNKLFDKYRADFPERFYNCGVAEANTIGVAAGLAMSGFRPIAYTITPFITTRCLEHIRNDLCYQNQNVIIVGVGSGLGYAELGPTHHSCEDIALLRALPNMSVICPGDPSELRAALRAALKHDGPVYIRIGKKGEPTIHNSIPELTIGKAIKIVDGKDLCLLTTGNMLPAAVETAEELKKHGITAGVMSFHTVKPLDKEALSEIFSKYSLVCTLEEHSMIGGFGSAVAEWLIDHNINGKIKSTLMRFGTRDEFMKTAGNQEYAREYYGISVEQILKKILLQLKK